MPASNFNKLALRNNGRKLEVGGVFVTHGDVIGDVTVRFVLIPENVPAALTDPIMGTARIRNVPLLASGSGIRQAAFATQVNNKFNLSKGKTVRGIGIAVAVKVPDLAESPKNQDPPAFETFTWCVNLKVT
jgi:hypothetical protein